ncbi:hypothetical protein I7I51_05541 [Histoplasma capsulatum]|uniref:Uncharacterized protein n=1 Tax=Ajellomyces capsulatus TaxID=5037 RepID=A0A8A1M2R9_AJECA|nr:hypothetical protein I7I51_05541 [Histoplasma capsulatum]
MYCTTVTGIFRTRGKYRYICVGRVQNCKSEAGNQLRHGDGAAGNIIALTIIVNYALLDLVSRGTNSASATASTTHVTTLFGAASYTIRSCTAERSRVMWHSESLEKRENEDEETIYFHCWYDESRHRIYDTVSVGTWEYVMHLTLNRWETAESRKTKLATFESSWHPT